MPNDDGTLNYEEVSAILAQGASTDAASATEDFSDVLSTGGDKPVVAQEAVESPEVPSGEEQPVEEVETPDTPAQTAYDETIRALTEKLEANQRQLEALMAAQKEPAVAKEEKKEIPVPDYTFQLPDQLFAMLRSEDPNEQRQGFAYMMQGAARAIHATIRAEYQQALTEASTSIPETAVAQIAQRQAGQEIFNDFYSTYQELNDQLYYPVVQQIAIQVMQEKKANGWSPEIRDLIAQRTYQKLKWAYTKPGSSQSAVAPAKPTPAKKPVPTSGQATTRGAAPAPDPFAELIYTNNH